LSNLGIASGLEILEVTWDWQTWVTIP